MHCHIPLGQHTLSPFQSLLYGEKTTTYFFALLKNRLCYLMLCYLVCGGICCKIDRYKEVRYKEGKKQKSKMIISCFCQFCAFLKNYGPQKQKTKSKMSKFIFVFYIFCQKV